MPTCRSTCAVVGRLAKDLACRWRSRMCNSWKNASQPVHSNKKQPHEFIEFIAAEWPPHTRPTQFLSLTRAECGGSFFMPLACVKPLDRISIHKRKAMTKQSAPRGRPPIGAILVDGQWELTEESLSRAAERLERHRRQCRERYRKNRAALARQRPDLFKYRQKPWMRELQNEQQQLSTEAHAPQPAEP